MKRKLVIAIVACSMLLGVAGFSYRQANAQKLNSLTVNDYVTKSNDLSKAISDKTERMKKLREAYTPKGLGTWTRVYSLSVAPLLVEANNKANDYMVLNTNLGTKITAYKEISNYWFANQNNIINESNKKLAEKEYDIMKTKNDKGVISDNQLSQAKISLNSAQATALQAKTGYEQIVYRINTQVGSSAGAGLELPMDKITYIPDSELNASELAANMTKNHKIMEPLYAGVDSYNKIIKIVEKQNKFDNIPVEDLTNFYKEELELVNMNMELRRRQVECASYAYVSKLNSLSGQIKLCEESLVLIKSNYDKALKQFELGQITQVEVEKARIGILNVNLQLINAQKDYMSASQEFKLFKEGYLGQ